MTRNNRPKDFTERVKPGLVTVVTFLLIYSGPPMLRVRDRDESLTGAIDAAVIFRLLVELMAILWVLHQWRKQLKISGHRPFKLRLPQALSLLFVACLSLSVFVSAAPALTMYKVCEMLVSLLFTATFVEIYGVDACLKTMFVANTLLCAIILTCAFVAPSLVIYRTEIGGGQRLRGDLIAPTEMVAVFALILLLARPHKPSSIWLLILLAFFGILVAWSLSRTALIILAVFGSLYLWRRMSKLATFSFAMMVAIVGIFVAPHLEKYRAAETVYTLSDRLGLWAYLAGVTLLKSPWIGLGYYSASRIYGPEYNERLGTAHSVFLEAFVGGGIFALLVLVILCSVLASYAVKFFFQHRESQLGFTLSMLYMATLMFGSIGGDIGYAPMGITFWSLSAMIPVFRQSLTNAAVLAPRHTVGPAVLIPGVTAPSP